MFDSNKSSNNEELVALLSKYFTQRGQFLAQVIRADMQSMSMPPLAVTNSNGNSHSNAYHNGNGNSHSNDNGNGSGHHVPNTIRQDLAPSLSLKPPVVTSPPAQSASPASKNVAEILVNLVVEQTGYPKESIGLELKLLDDLNLDSIKAGEVVAATAKECGVAGQLDPSTLANATLQEVIEIVRAAMPTATPVQPVAAPVAQPLHSNNATRLPENNDWVRNFAVEYVAQGK